MNAGQEVTVLNGDGTIYTVIKSYEAGTISAVPVTSIRDRNTGAIHYQETISLTRVRRLAE